MATTAERCSSVVTLKRADQLCLGDDIIIDGFGRFQVQTVVGLSLLNDTVEIRTTSDGEILTKIGAGFHVVSLSERFK